MTATGSAHGSENPRDGGGNRLRLATSPYLLQHAHNPVDWYPWGPEALARARTENRPIFLSIGYSACHWCHVMEREVFEKQDIANIMNAHFVNVKVDREERPDLDDLYMLATQVATGSGGWPMSVWLTPDLKPFYAGTYFPPVDAYGRPGFPRLCLAIADAWRTRPDDLRAQADKIADAVRNYADEASDTPLNENVDLPGVLQRAVGQFADRFDPEYGGLGHSPKFPPSQALALWLELLKSEAARRANNNEGDPLLPDNDLAQVRMMLTATLDHMMRGGIYDHVGGAFARYSTDQYWLVPHFEKMLYDNAQLAPVYALASVAYDREDYARTARGTLDFWLREMTSDRGAFYSTLDADSEGVEGKFYVWTQAQIREALPDAGDAELIETHLGVTPEGNWHEGGPGANVLHIARTVEDLAPRYNTTPADLQKRIDKLLKTLRETRRGRIPPGTDDKILTSWNGLMVSAMAICGRVLHEPKYLEAAHRAMGFVLMRHVERGRTLLRTSRGDSAAHTPAFLEDHAYLLNGLIDLIDATTPTSLPGTMARKRALEMADTLVNLFEDKTRGGFFFSTPGHEQLFTRMKNATDGATPSANGMAVRALLRLAAVSGKLEYRDIALRAVQAFAGTIVKQPSGFPTILHALVEDARSFARTAHLNTPRDIDEDLDLAWMPGGTEAPIPLSEELPADSPNPSPLLQLSAELAGGNGPVKAGREMELAVHVKIADGYHIQLHKPEDREAFATVVRARAEKIPLAGQVWHYPQPQERQAPPEAGGPVQGFAGDITIRGILTLAPHALPGRHQLRVTLLAQPCTATACLPPERATVAIEIDVV